MDRVQQENNALYEKIVSYIEHYHSFSNINSAGYSNLQGSIQNSPRHSSLLNEMECDDDHGIGDGNKSFNSADAIVKEARTVYNQLKMLHFTLKGNQDGDSGRNLVYATC